MIYTSSMFAFVLCFIVVITMQKDNIGNSDNIYSKVKSFFNRNNFTEYMTLCDSSIYEMHKCFKMSTLMLKDISIDSIEQFNQLPMNYIDNISYIFHYIGEIYYYGYLNKSPDLVKGLENFIIGAYLGNKRSLFNIYLLINNMLIDQVLINENYIERLKTFKLLKEISNTQFYNNFKLIISEDYNDEIRNSIAIGFLYSSALGKYHEALNALGFRFLNGYGVKESCNTSLSYYQEGAYQTIKYITAQHSRNYYLYKSLVDYEYIDKKFSNIQHDKTSLIEYSKIEASKGDINSIKFLAETYLFGIQTKQNFKLAFYWFNKGALLNDTSCIYNLAELYLNGWGVEKDYKKAYDLLIEASMQNFSKAWNSLGYMYYYGYYVESNPKRAYDYFKKSISKDTEYDGYYNLLTILLENNDELSSDYIQAYNYGKILAEKGHNYGTYFFAMLNKFKIGTIVSTCSSTVEYFKVISERSPYIKKKFAIALDKYKKGYYKSATLIFMDLAEIGMDLGELNAAILLQKYDIFKNKNYQKFLGFKYMKLAERTESSYAKIALGNFYFNGYGQLEKDYDKALQYYQRAKSTGVNDFFQAHSSFNLGLMYNFGFGVEKNVTKAKSFYNITINTKTTGKYAAHIMIVFNDYLVESDVMGNVKGFAKAFLVFWVYPYWKICIYVIYGLMYSAFFISLKMQKE